MKDPRKFLGSLEMTFATGRRVNFPQPPLWLALGSVQKRRRFGARRLAVPLPPDDFRPPEVKRP